MKKKMIAIYLSLILVSSFGIYNIIILNNDGEKNASDEKDITNPLWDEVPGDRISVFGASFFYDINATDNKEIDQYWINDTVHFQIDGNGVISNATHLLIGLYPLTIKVNDTSGNEISVEITITIQDLEDPTWVIAPADQTILLGAPFSYDVDATDNDAIDQYWINDTVHFQIDGNGVISNATHLLIGLYLLTIKVNDTSGNEISVEITITIQDLEDPTWVVAPADQTILLGAPFSYDVEATDNDAIAQYWIDDTTYFQISGSGMITNTTVLFVGVYPLIVFVNDTNGNSIQGPMIITIQDLEDPTWVVAPADQTILLGASFSYDVEATDNDAIDQYWIDDTTNFQISGSGMISNTTVLFVGAYPLIVFVNDSNGNSIQGPMIITIQDLEDPTWVVAPADQTILLGAPFSYDVEATDNDAIAQYWIDDTTNFQISGSGMITNTTLLFVGVYPLIVFVNDTNGNSIQGPMIITIQDLEDPTWVIAPADQTINNSDPFTFDVEATDNSAIDQYWINDIINFQINGSGVITNNTVLSDGVYSLMVYVNDTSGNTIQGSMEIIVEDKLGPTIDICPNDAICTSATQLVEITATDDNDIDMIWFNWEGTNVTYTAPVQIIFPEGPITLYAWSNDTIGNVGSTSVTFIIDTLSFISTWSTSNTISGSSNSTAVKLPLESDGIYNFTVYWGDGTSDIITEYDQIQTTHGYNTAGTYSIRINGTCKGWRFNYSGDRTKIQDISQWGNLNLGNNGDYFRGCTNLRISAENPLNLEGTTDLNHMFYGCFYLNDDISGWDVSNVTDMSYMFYGANYFNQNIGGWNVSNVTDMNNMFLGAGNFNQNIGGWDVSNVTDMSYMFRWCHNFNQYIGSWDVSSVTSMYSMFRDTDVFNQNIGGWDVSSVTNMGCMFSSAKVFSQNIGGWDVSHVTNMESMFNEAITFNRYIGGWDVSSVTEMYRMFYGASLFNQNIGGWNVDATNSIIEMFRDATNFNQNLEAWDDNLWGGFGPNMYDAFYNCPTQPSWYLP